MADLNRQDRNAELDSDPSYLYRWNYGEQRTHDARRASKEKKRGIAVYATVMASVFLLCFVFLAVALIWYGESTPIIGGGNGNGLSTADVSEMVTPSTVLIYATNTTAYGYGTGFFLRSDGYIATNYHVLEGMKNFTVTLYSGKTLEAELVGYSTADDLAVIKVRGTAYPAVKIGDSDTLRVGDTAIAVGNPSGTDAPWTTTQGIISALDREVLVEGSSAIGELTMIQTDAALNPGNSGGPLCNDRGEVIGIVTRKLSDTEGISFALPINGAIEILNAIIKDGNADNVDSSISKVRPTIGITGGTIAVGDPYTYRGVEYTAEKNGVLVSSVSAQGAANGILQVCDIITAMDGVTVTNMEELTEELYRHKVGDRVEFTVWRAGSSQKVTVTLGGAS